MFLYLKCFYCGCDLWAAINTYVCACVLKKESSVWVHWCTDDQVCSLVFFGLWKLVSLFAYMSVRPELLTSFESCSLLSLTHNP